MLRFALASIRSSTWWPPVDTRRTLAPADCPVIAPVIDVARLDERNWVSVAILANQWRRVYYILCYPQNFAIRACLGGLRMGFGPSIGAVRTVNAARDDANGRMMLWQHLKRVRHKFYGREGTASGRDSPHPYITSITVGESRAAPAWSLHPAAIPVAAQPAACGPPVASSMSRRL